MIRVYQFYLRPPVEGAELVREQLRAGHSYANDLIVIERGRRGAVRACEDTQAVRDAIDRCKAATKSTRKTELAALRDARRDARERAVDELARISDLDASIRRDARALAKCAWGTYQAIEASAQQVRKSNLYDDDGYTPSDPKFRRLKVCNGGTGEGQIGVHVQNRVLTTAEVLAGHDTFVRLIMDPSTSHRAQRGVLWLRVGSDGRAPIWAKFPALIHRNIPDAATWTWVRVSCRQHGPRERWSVEITLDTRSADPRLLDTALRGAIAVEATWDRPDDAITVAAWRDADGRCGNVMLPERIRLAFSKASAIRAVRDTLRRDMAEHLSLLLHEDHSPRPTWLSDYATGLHLWKSPDRFHRFVQRWRSERCDAVRPAYDLLQTWEMRDLHLWEYEVGARRGALRHRRDFYRKLAVGWSRKYAHIILDDRRLDREARWGEASEIRFAASPSELRGCLEQAFGDARLSTHTARPAVVSENDERGWRERAIDEWNAVGARSPEKYSNDAEIRGGAWARRKAKKGSIATQAWTARNDDGKV